MAPVEVPQAEMPGRFTTNLYSRLVISLDCWENPAIKWCNCQYCVNKTRIVRLQLNSLLNKQKNKLLQALFIET